MIDDTRVSDEYAQFLISVYELCAAAHLGQLDVEVCDSSGRRSIGVPTVDQDRRFDWSRNGAHVVIWIEQYPVVLGQIMQCTLISPPR